MNTVDARVLAASFDDGTLELRVLLPSMPCYRNVGQPTFRRHVGVWYVNVLSGQTPEQARTSAFADCIVIPPEQVLLSVAAPADMATGDPIATWRTTDDGKAWQAVVATADRVDVSGDRPLPVGTEIPDLVPTGMPDSPGWAPGWTVPAPVPRRDPGEPWVAYLVDANEGPGRRAVRVTLADAPRDEGRTTDDRAVRHREWPDGAVAIAEGHGVDNALLDTVLAGLLRSTEPAALLMGAPPDGLAVLTAGRPTEPVSPTYPSFGRYYPGSDLLLTHEPAMATALADLVTGTGVGTTAARVGDGPALRIDDGDGTGALVWFGAPGVLTTVRGPVRSTDAIDAIARTLHVPTAPDLALLRDGWGRLGRVRFTGCASDVTVYGGWGSAVRAPGGGDDLRLLLVNDGAVDCAASNGLTLTPDGREAVVTDTAATTDGVVIASGERIGISIAWSKFDQRCPAVTVRLDFTSAADASTLEPLHLALCDGAQPTAALFAA